MTPIASMVTQMIASGVAPEMIALAVETAELCSHPPDIQVDTAAENRRAWDREYRRDKRDSTRHPPDSTRHPEITLSLKTKDKKEKKERARATRVPPDWQPSEEMIAYARELGMSDAEMADLGESMRDWSASSPKGAKLDWPATWRTWCRKFVNEHPRPKSMPPTGVLNGKFFIPRADPRFEEWEKHLGKSIPIGKSGGSWFDSERPPQPGGA